MSSRSILWTPQSMTQQHRPRREARHRVHLIRQILMVSNASLLNPVASCRYLNVARSVVNELPSQAVVAELMGIANERTASPQLTRPVCNAICARSPV